MLKFVTCFIWGYLCALALPFLTRQSPITPFLVLILAILGAFFIVILFERYERKSALKKMQEVKFVKEKKENDG